MAFEEFRERERDGWHQRAESYAHTTALATTQAIPALLSAVRIFAGAHVLDVSCGPGFAAGAAAAIGARAEGIDFAAGMVAEASRRFPDIQFSEGDAQALDAADISFDAVICNFGIFHYVDPKQAIAEAYRVLKPGGRYAFSQWCAPQESPVFSVIFPAILAHADMSLVDPAPQPFDFSNRDRAMSELKAVGFDQVEVTEVPSILRAPVGDFFNFFQTLSVRIPIILSKQSDSVREAIRSDISAGIAEYSSDGGTLVPMPSFVISGRRP